MCSAVADPKQDRPQQKQTKSQPHKTPKQT